MPRPSQKKYLVTGAAGFVGSCLVRKLLAKKCETSIFLKRNSNLWRIKDLLKNPYLHVYYSDLADPVKLTSLIKKISPDIIYHLAARGAYSTQNDAAEIFEVNIFGTLHLLQACQEIPYELFVNTGSTSEYGFKNLPMSEKDILEPASYYAIAKAAATHLSTFIARSAHKPIVTVRLFSAYGPYEEPARFFPTLLKSLYSTQPLNLVSGKIARDFIYVNDVVDFYLCTSHLKKFPGEVFNLGTGKQSTIREAVKTAMTVTGRKTQLNWQNMEAKTWDATHWVADMKKTKKLLGWQPRYSLTAGIEDMWRWFQMHTDLYV